MAPAAVLAKEAMNFCNSYTKEDTDTTTAPAVQVIFIAGMYRTNQSMPYRGEEASAACAARKVISRFHPGGAFRKGYILYDTALLLCR